MPQGNERFVTVSPTPVLVIGSNAKAHPVIKKILVPTEFTEDDHQIFWEAVEYARILNASIVLFNGMYDELNSNLDFSGPVRQNYELNGETVDFFTYREAKMQERRVQAVFNASCASYSPIKSLS